jgi:hypothetical protein
MRLSWVGHRIWSDSTLVDCACCTVKGCGFKGQAGLPTTGAVAELPAHLARPRLTALRSSVLTKNNHRHRPPLPRPSPLPLPPPLSTQDICPYCITCICHVWEAFVARDSAKKPTAWRGPIINSHLVLELDLDPSISGVAAGSKSDQEISDTEDSPLSHNTSRHLIKAFISVCLGPMRLSTGS